MGRTDDSVPPTKRRSGNVEDVHVASLPQTRSHDQGRRKAESRSGTDLSRQTPTQKV